MGETTGGATSPVEATAVQRKSTDKRRLRTETDAPTRDGLGHGTEEACVHNTQDTVALEGEPASIRQGNKIGRYLVLGRLGAGGMGTVYAAYDPELDRKVALKFLFQHATDDEAERAEIMREGQSMARMAHANVCSVYDVGDHEGRVFFAMEHIEGDTLRKWIKKTNPSWKEIVRALSGAGRGIASAHAAGIVHRDLKPSNIMVEPTGRALVTDFGIAALSAVETTSKTAEVRARIADLLDSSDELRLDSQDSDTTAGTPPYMSPEQHLGTTVDARSDQFGFCATLYVALYGTLPFKGKGLEAVRDSILDGAATPVPSDTKVPRWVQKVVFKGLQRSPDDRFESMQALLSALSIDRRIRQRGFAGLALASLGMLALVAWLSNQHAVAKTRRALECQGADASMQEVWNSERAERARLSFEESKVKKNEITWQRVEQTLDQYGQQWTAMHTEACTATRIRGEVSESILDLRMTCLERSKTRLNHLVSAFEAADAKTVKYAVKAALSLQAVSDCSDIPALSRRIALPEDQETQDAVEKLHDQLDQVTTMALVGQMKEGLVVARAVAAEAEKLDYMPIRAEAYFVLAFHYFRMGDVAKAEEELLRTTWAAQASQNDLYWAESANLSIFISTMLKGDYEEATERAHWAKAVMLRFDQDDEIMSRYELSVGTLAHRTGDYNDALKHYSKAANILRALYGKSNYRLAKVLNNMASSHFRLARFEEAIALQEQSLEIKRSSLGPGHADLGNTLVNMGEAYRRQKQYDKAMVKYEAAQAIFDATLDANHPSVGFPPLNMGEVFLERDMPTKALVVFRKALSIWETSLGKENIICAYPLTGIGESLLLKGIDEEALAILQQALALRDGKKGDPEELARTRFAYARALERTATDPVEAISIAQRCLITFEELGEATTGRAEQVREWLAQRRP